MDEASQTSSKRKRLSHACRSCRARKVRCDERLPACTNCARAGTECVTDDPRRPHLASVKRTRTSSVGSSALSIATNDQDRAGPSASPRESSLKPQSPVPSQPKLDAPPSATSPWADPTWMRNALGSASASIIADSQAQDRFKYVGSSNWQVFSHWIDLLLAKQRPSQSRSNSRTQSPDNSISEHFDHGRIHSEEYHLPLRPVLPGLSTTIHFDAVLDDFFQQANAIFPIFEEDVLRHDTVQFIQKHRLNDPLSMQLDQLTPYKVPMLATIYFVTALSLLDAGPQHQVEMKSYLAAGYSLYGHIVGAPYLSSVQAMLLLHLVFRSCSKDGASWQSLGAAIRIAYSIGLHRAPVSPPLHSAALERTKGRVWWCCYTLDRIATLDSGRPTMINEIDVQLAHPRLAKQVATPAGVSSSSPSTGNSEDASRDMGIPDQVYRERALACLVALCRIMAEIHKGLYTSRNHSVNEAELFTMIARLDQKLMDWSSTCVLNLHLPTMSSEEALRGVSKWRDLQTLHLLCTYHFTVINLHRASVMLDTRLYRHHVADKLTRRGKERLLSAETICCGSARAIIRCINQFRLLHRCNTRMVAGTISLSAVYVLAICIFKHPKEWNVASDLALIDSIAKTVMAEYLNDGMPAGFTEIFATLQRLALKCVKQSSSRPASPPLSFDFGADNAQINLEPLSKSLGFGQVVPTTLPPEQAQAQLPATTMSAADSADAMQGELPTSFQSLLEIDQPDDLLCSLLGLPDFLTPGAAVVEESNGDATAEMDALDEQ